MARYTNLITGKTARLPGDYAPRRAETPPPGTLRIVLALPPRQLSPNAREHWASKARAVKAYREAAAVACREAIGGCGAMLSATVEARFYFKDKRRRDKDNLLASLKSAFDGLADAGLVADDSALTYAPVVMGVDADWPRVELWIVKGV